MGAFWPKRPKTALVASAGARRSRLQGRLVAGALGRSRVGCALGSTTLSGQWLRAPLLVVKGAGMRIAAAVAGATDDASGDAPRRALRFSDMAEVASANERDERWETAADLQGDGEERAGGRWCGGRSVGRSGRLRG